jgi:hypothetical protein
MHEVIKQVGDMRLIRMPDEHVDWDTLKGDLYNPTCNPDMTVNQLKDEERAFECRVNDEGVWGYEVQRWNGDIDGGWEHVDSIWGFVGDDFEGSGYDTGLLRLMTKVDA